MTQDIVSWKKVTQDLRNQRFRISVSQTVHFAGEGTIDRWTFLFTKKDSEGERTTLTIAHGRGNLDKHIAAFNKLCDTIVENMLNSEQPTLKYRIGNLLTSYEWVDNPEERFAFICREYPNPGFVQRL